MSQASAELLVAPPAAEDSPAPFALEFIVRQSA